jgi:hypothetical protein
VLCKMCLPLILYSVIWCWQVLAFSCFRGYAHLVEFGKLPVRLLASSMTGTQLAVHAAAACIRFYAYMVCWCSPVAQLLAKPPAHPGQYCTGCTLRVQLAWVEVSKFLYRVQRYSGARELQQRSVRP